MTTFSLVCNTWLAALDAMSTSHKASSLAVELKTSLILEDLFELHVYEFQHGYITYTSLYIYIWRELYINIYTVHKQDNYWIPKIPRPTPNFGRQIGVTFVWIFGATPSRSDVHFAQLQYGKTITTRHSMYMCWLHERSMLGFLVEIILIQICECFHRYINSW